jgi:hypothetical protein
MMIKSQVGGLPLPSMNASSFNDIDIRNRVELQQQLEGEKEKLKKLKTDYKKVKASFESNKEKLDKAKEIYPDLAEKLG